MTRPEQGTRLRSELRALLAIAVPVVLSELGWIGMGVVDTVMVGRLGPESIGAVGIASATYYAPTLFGIGLMLGLDTLVSQAWGARDYDECHKWLAEGVYLAAIYTPVSMLLVWLAPLVYRRFGVQPEVAGPAAAYLLLLNWGTLPLLFYAAFRRYLQGVHRLRPVTFALVSANLVNWFGNWALIYGHCGLPRMGLTGSALSTCVARAYMAGVLIFAAWRHEAARGHSLFVRWPGPQWKRLRALIRLGAPGAAQIVLEVGAFGAATLLAGRLDPAALAAHQIVLNCASVSFMVPLGVSTAAAVSVGHAIGAGDFARARRVGWLAVGVGASFMACAAVVFLCAPRLLLHIYTRDGAVVRFGLPLLGLAAAFQIFDGLQTVGTGALRGLGETRVPMLINLFGYWLFGLPLGYALCFHFGRGIFGLWIGLSLALVLIACLVLWRWSRDARSLAGRELWAQQS